MKRTIHQALVISLLALGLRATVASTAAESNEEMERRMKNAKSKVMPKPVKQSPPEFPRGLAQLGLVGEVVVDFVLDQKGNVQNPVVVQSNNPWFERAAIVAILKWKFTPALLDGEPAAIRVRQKIEFSLWNGDSPWELSNMRAKKNLPPEMQWDIAPKPVHTAFPVYPFEALQAGVKGKVRLLYIINEKGRVSETKLLEATTPEMGHAALATIDMWRFKPAVRKDGTKDGKKVATLLGMEYEFEPDGQGGVPVSPVARDLLRDLQKHPESITKAADLDQPLKPLSQRAPIYPTALRQANQPGEAVIEFFVDKEGDAQLPRIISSSAPEFGYAAAQAVATWRFEPPLKNKKPAVTRVRVPVNFGIKEAPAPDAK